MLKPAKFTIRPATEEDLPAVVGIYNWAINQTFATIESEPLSKEEAVEWWSLHASQTVTLVAEEEGDVIGWARLLPWKQRGYEVVEDLIYVDPLYQRRGVGKRLLGETIETASAGGYRTIVASVAADNQAGLKLHLDCFNFEQVGTIHNAAHKFGRWMDITLLQRGVKE